MAKKKISKKLVEKNSHLMLVRESCTFSEPVATSSPNVKEVNRKVVSEPDATSSPNVKEANRKVAENTFVDLKGIFNKVIREHRTLHEELKAKIKTKYDLLMISTNVHLLLPHYTCDENGLVPKENGLVKNKRIREAEVLMPPPSSVIRASSRKRSSKRPRNDLENRPASVVSRSRSSSRIQAKSLLKEENGSNRVEDGFKTPAPKEFLRMRHHNIATVTPGPNANAPQCILRRPNPGETAISLSGSPLLVSTDQVASVPQITVPLGDGRVVSVLARDSLNPDDFPTMDPETLAKLKKLHAFLGQLE